MERRKDIRNIAIIAHVDHGKTTLVDAMLKQTHAERNLEQMGERIMDSMDLEKERGITIKAKNASVLYNGVKINIIDTPGHADFGGEVERTLRMAEGVLLLVDAQEGPMPQTKFVLQKALSLGMKVIVVINKIDKKNAEPDKVADKTFDLFVRLNASDYQLDFPIIYASATQGFSTTDHNIPTTSLAPLFDAIIENIPAPEINSSEPLQMLVLSITYDTYKGKIGIGKISSGKIIKGQNVSQIMINGKIIKGKITDILIYKGLQQATVESADAGEIVAVAGLPEIAIGETIADALNPKQLPPVEIDQPTVQMTFSVNSSPFAGKEGNLVTSRQIRERLDKELETNLALRVKEEDTGSFLVSGRGELHLAVLIEQMRREGFELSVSQPQVIFHEVKGQKMEPYELVTVDVPAEHQGIVITECGERKGVLSNMEINSIGELHLEYDMPTRGVIGLKLALMTKTRGTAVVNHIFNKYEPFQPDLFKANAHGSLIALENGISRSYALYNLQQRATMFLGNGEKVYEGQVAGQNSRDEDMEVNICKEKRLSNMRSKGADEALILTPPRQMSLEMALEYIGQDELVEVTPKSIRIRKIILSNMERKRQNRKM